MLIVNDIFNKVLIEPAQTEGVNKLRIVSGFATANMVEKHVYCLLDDHQKTFDIELIVGMVVTTTNLISAFLHIYIKVIFFRLEPNNFLS